MSVRVVTALVFVLALSMLAADISVGCAGKGYVYGVVQAKFAGTGDNDMSVLQIASESYTVPAGFYSEVQVGDLVRFDGKTWTIVKSAPTTFGNQTPAGTPPPGTGNIPPAAVPAH